MYAEKMIRQYYDIAVTGESMDRNFFPRKWVQVSQQFQEKKAVNVAILWVCPIILYSAALLIAAFCAKGADAPLQPNDAPIEK